MFRIRRAAVMTLGAVAIGAIGGFGLASPAWAGVTVTPSVAPRGEGVKVTLQIPEERAGAHTTKVELVAPRDAIVTEIYPMSTADWAPAMTTRTLTAPVTGLHGTTKYVTDRITWTRVAAAPAAAKAVSLTVSMGPMPAEGAQVTLALVQTYSDGTVVRWDGAEAAHPPVTIKLVEVAQEGGSHHGTAQEPQQPVPAASTEDSGGSYGILAAGLLAGLGLGVVGFWLILRSRRPSSPS